MKTKFLNGLLMLMIFSTILSSCKKEDTAKAIEDIIPTKIKAKIDGVEWNAKAVTLVKLITATNYFTFTGTSLDGNIVMVSFFGKEVKEYRFIISTTETTIQFDATYTLATEATDVYKVYSGKATLTKVDLVNKLISGTFNFKTKNAKGIEKVFTDGSFTDLAYTESSTK